MGYDAGYYGKNIATLRRGLTVYFQVPTKGNKERELLKAEVKKSADAFQHSLCYEI